MLNVKVFKFGGASVKDASAVKNVANIVQLFPNEKIGVVISAMGKTTNTLEHVVSALCDQNKRRFIDLIKESKDFHFQIMKALFDDPNNIIFTEIESQFNELEKMYNAKLSDNINFEYDQIVSLGEILSTRIVCSYLNQCGISSAWTDARELIRTNNNYREGEVDWEKTEALFRENFLPKFNSINVQITQGFIGHTEEGLTTTLGREGSDYTAGIMAFCCDADSVTIWKDVPGMLNADPKWFENTVKLDRISYTEAIELSYYGASVIHPKTLKPLQNKDIPLFVKSFVDPKGKGTTIQSCTTNDKLVPSFIFKMDQVLFSFMPKDFSFIVEKHLSDIFERLSRVHAKINLMQNTALKFSVLVDGDKVDVDQIKNLFEDSYLVSYESELELVTVRHCDEDTLNRVTLGKEIILSQKTKETARLIVKQK